MAAGIPAGGISSHLPCRRGQATPSCGSNVARLPSAARRRGAVAMSLSTCAAAAAASKKAAVAVAAAAAACEVNPSLARVWREIQGANDWADLVVPLHPLLRHEVIRYGEFVCACYHAFDLDAASPRYLTCKYGKQTMLREAGMGAAGYEVTKYIYATPDISIPTQPGSCRSRWIGYVAVASDDEVRRLGRRDVVVSFRGTVTSTEWIANFMSSLTPARLDPHDPRPDVMVELGFLSMYTSDDSTCRFSHGSCREQLLSELSRIIERYRGEELSITFSGHSLGSSIAILAAYDLTELGLHRPNPWSSPSTGRSIPITVYSFGGPRVGNAGFKERCERLGVKVLRVVNVNDPVTKMPGVFLNEKLSGWAGRRELPWRLPCYTHVGVELALDFFKMKDPAGVHDLGTYIRLLKCPDVVQEGGDLLGKPAAAMRLLSSCKLVSWAWQDAAINVGNLVQSLGI